MQRTYQSELKYWLTRFGTEHGYPQKAVTIVLPQQKLIAHYEPKAGIPQTAKLRQTAREIAIATGAGAAVAGGVALIIGRTLLGGFLSRIGIAGAFGAIGIAPLVPAILVGGTLVGAAYALYQVGKYSAQNQQAQEFGAELKDHLQNFKASSLPPSDLVIVTTPDRHITVIFDPEMPEKK